MENNQFRIEWKGHSGHPEQEIAATEASWVWQLRGESLTAHVLEGQLSEVMEIPLYPMAEWFASNWWNIFWEFPNHTYEYRHRHYLPSGQGPYYLPPLLFQRVADFIVIKFKKDWQNKRKDEISFFEKKDLYLPIEELKVHLKGDLLSKVFNKLSNEGILDNLFMNSYDLLINGSSEEQEICKFAALGGEHPFDLSDEQEQYLEKVSSEISGEYLEELLPATRLEGLEETLGKLKDMGIDSQKRVTKLGLLRELKQGITKEHQKPWKNGYEAARYVREQMQLNSPKTSQLHLARALNTEPEQLFITQNILPKGFRTTTFEDRDNNPAIYLQKKLKNPGKRFALARGIYDYLAYTSFDHEPLLATDIKTTRQQANKAFAAEFLAPKAFLEEQVEKLQTSTLNKEDLAELADYFEVSEHVIHWQIFNHNIADIEDWLPNDEEKIMQLSSTLK